MIDILLRAEQKKKIAHNILNELKLLETWGQVGVSHLVGATSYNLVVNRDIDIETFCETPKPQDVFKVLTHLSHHKNVIGIKYHNYLNSPFNGLYTKLTYRYPDDIEEHLWNIDMWLFPSNHSGPLSRDLVGFMNSQLTDERRMTILSIKEQLASRNNSCPSVFIYQAVIHEGIQNITQFLHWIKNQDTDKTFKLENYQSKHGNGALTI